MRDLGDASIVVKLRLSVNCLKLYFVIVGNSVHLWQLNETMSIFYEIRISRVSKKLRDKVKQLAKVNKRTMTSQAELMLEEIIKLKKL